MMKIFHNISGILIVMHLNYWIATDWNHGKYDPWGPYPRIPDKESLKKEIDFAEECRKYIKAPKQIGNTDWSRN